ncbi:6-phosphogluconolactonase [Candidatus Gottesmanbacteria bacterium]|nr:6-phosphogluconolactonase [Candidatus Gottesmanbacteria bacterium]
MTLTEIPISSDATAAFTPVIAGYRETIFHHPDGPNIHMLQSPEAARLAMADDNLDILTTANDGDLVLLSTGNTSKAFYPVFVARAQERRINLARFRYGHIDNYVYDPLNYPFGTDNQDYEKFLRKHFIEPAGIPKDNFFPIHGYTADPHKVASDYDQWLESQRIVVAIAGAFGPKPVAHFAFMKPGMNLEVGVAAINLSGEVVRRDVTRAEEADYPPPPTRAITLGLRHFRRAQHIFTINCGSEYVSRVTLALTGPIDPRVIGTYFRTEGFGKKVNIYLDPATAQPIIEHFSIQQER